MIKSVRARLGALVLAVVLAMVALVSAESASASGPMNLGGRAPSVVVAGARAPSLAAPAKGARVQYSSPRVGGLRLRSRGSFGGSVKGLLYRGDRVQVIGYSANWMHVQLTKRSAGGARKGTKGWVWKSYLYGPSCRSHAKWPCTAWR
ncbi:SH3 domain-containing protein [Streptomyces sp. NBC_00448]|uniref:SH3 domain-containing protein n=1 Tax=Streptomyces sp. NBC_00448 TaxID=2903652 RepID=UPI002E244484